MRFKVVLAFGRDSVLEIDYIMVACSLHDLVLRVRISHVKSFLAGFIVATVLVALLLIHIFERPLLFQVEYSNFANKMLKKSAGKRWKILCWISTKPSNHRLKALHVKATWAPRCDKFIFFSTEDDPSLPTVVLSNITAPESRALLWPKAMAALQYCYENHLQEYDWFLKADDDTYVIVENLRNLLSTFDPNKSWFFGRRIKFKHDTKPALSGGAGYVLSREALRKLVEDGLRAENGTVNCNRQVRKPVTDDLELNECLDALKIPEGNSHDSQNRGRFWNFPLEPKLSMYGNAPHLHYWDHEKDSERISLYHSISPSSISFHHVKPSQMYLYDYLLHNVKVMGNDSRADYVR